MARLSYDENGGSTNIGFLANIYKTYRLETKMLGMASLGVENVETALESIFALPRGSQVPYMNKNQKFGFLFKRYSDHIREYFPY